MVCISCYLPVVAVLLLNWLFAIYNSYFKKATAAPAKICTDPRVCGGSSTGADVCVGERTGARDGGADGKKVDATSGSGSSGSVDSTGAADAAPETVTELSAASTSVVDADTDPQPVAAQ